MQSNFNAASATPQPPPDFHRPAPDPHHNGTTPTKPAALQYRHDLADVLPDELTTRAQFVVWHYEIVEGKSGQPSRFTKVLYNARTGAKASSTNPDTWSTFDEAMAVHASGQYAGIGFVLSADDPFAGIDLDHCFNRETGELSPMAADVIARFDSYTEVSPSGEGIRIFLVGVLPPGRRKETKRGIEMYCDGRFLTITGNTISDCNEVKDGSAELAKWHAEVFPAKPKTTATRAPIILSMNDEQIIEKARKAKNGAKFIALFDHGSGDHGSGSETDLALLGHLKFYTRDAAQLERLWRASAVWREEKPGQRPDYVERTITAALENVTETYDPLYNRPRHKGAVQTSEAPPENSEAENSEAEAEPIHLELGYPIDDMGNGQRFASQHRNRVRWCETWGCWLTYTGERWERDTKGVADSMAKITARLVVNEAQACENDHDRAALLKHAATLTKRVKRDTMLKDAKSEPGISINPLELDADKWLFNVLNGTLDLRTGELLPHDSNRLQSKLAPVVFDRSAACPKFDAFILKICNGKPAIVDCLHRQLGYSLTGETKEQNFTIGHGDGSNGKSTLLQTVLELMGDYGLEIEPDTIMIRRQERMAVDIADLFNIRFVVTGESNDTQRLDEGKIKKFTGGEQLTGERKFEHPFKFWPQFKLFLATNHLPEIRGTDEGIWRRVMPVPFDVRFWRASMGESGKEELQADPNLRDSLREEFPGILNWLLEGCRKWQQDGLTWPEEVRKKKKSYREEQDVLGPFLADCCALGAALEATAKELFSAYEAWCINNEGVNSSTFGKRLKERGFTQKTAKVKGKATRQWIGLTLQVADEPSEPDKPQAQMNGYTLDTVTRGYADSDILEDVQKKLLNKEKRVTTCNHAQERVTKTAFERENEKTEADY